jgi:uncharacterized membrane protein
MNNAQTQFVLAALSTYTLAATLSAQVFSPLLGPPNTTTTSARNISRAGGFVVGGSRIDDINRITVWGPSGRRVLDQIPSNYSVISYGISDDGETVVGLSNASGGFGQGFRSVGNSFELIPIAAGRTYNFATAVSADGEVLTGFSGGGTRPATAFLLSRDGTQEDLGSISPEHSSLPIAMSASGNIIVGSASMLNSSMSRAFRWSRDSGMQSLGVLGSNFYSSESLGISANGRFIVGRCDNLGFLWTQELGMQGLVMPIGYTLGRPNAISDNGAVFGGAMRVSGSSSEDRAMLRLPYTGIVDLNLYLPTLGIDLTGWVLTSTTGVSADGTMICGAGTYNGVARGWALTNIPTPSTALPMAAAAALGVRRRRNSVTPVL